MAAPKEVSEATSIGADGGVIEMFKADSVADASIMPVSLAGTMLTECQRAILDECEQKPAMA